MDLRLRADALVLAIVLLAGCASDPSTSSAPSAPSATPSSPVSPRPSMVGETGGVYLALGDSITFGIGVPRPQQNGYVARVADALSGLTADPRIRSARVFAVPGETAAGFLDRRLDDVERAIEELGPGVELVTIGLGANELLRARREPACVADRASDACRAEVVDATEVAASSLDAVVAGVQSALAAAGSDAAVLLLAYYNPDRDALAVASVVGSDGIVGCNPLEERPGLNDRIACVAEARSVRLVDLHTAFVGREDELTRFRAGDVHPNAEGYQVIADTILDALPAGAGSSPDQVFVVALALRRGRHLRQRSRLHGDLPGELAHQPGDRRRARQRLVRTRSLRRLDQARGHPPASPGRRLGSQWTSWIEASATHRSPRPA